MGAMQNGDYQRDLLNRLRHGPVHMTGIKGTGMAALAEILHRRSITITGSDGPETYFTDELLQRLGIVPRIGFSPDHIPPETQVLVYSAAYAESNEERREAMRRGIPTLSYFEALGLLAHGRTTLAVVGVHGKTSTTAMIGTMLAQDDPSAPDPPIAVTVVAGSAVPTFGGRATMCQGDALFVVEACEYRRHFLHFTPTVMLVTGVEWDHQDYYTQEADIHAAFLELAQQITPGGALVYCADDPGACRLAAAISPMRRDITVEAYGFSATGEGKISAYATGEGVQYAAFGTDSARWELSVPGRHMVQNAAGAVTALTHLLPDSVDRDAWRRRITAYRGTRRRGEIVGEAAGILVLDDYAHHPTAIRATLQGFASFYPKRRLVVDFMSHTYSRTEALLNEFAQAFDAADEVVFNGIYPSAREEPPAEDVAGRLYRAIQEHHPHVLYEADFSRAATYLCQRLQSGDIFITMGAGDNFRIGQMVLATLRKTAPQASPSPKGASSA